MRQLNEVEKAIVRTVAANSLCTWEKIRQVCYPSWHTKPETALNDAYWYLIDEGIIDAHHGNAWYTTDWTDEDIARGVRE